MPIACESTSVQFSKRRKGGARNNLVRFSILAACALAAFAVAAPAEAAGGPPPIGTYACASYRTFVGFVKVPSARCIW